jgi:hypothetical protein
MHIIIPGNEMSCKMTAIFEDHRILLIDTFFALRDEKTLDKILEQGLIGEHRQYKE